MLADVGAAAALTTLEVQSTAGCPTPADVEAEIRWRAPAAQLGPEAPRRLRIELAREPRGFVATMTYQASGTAAAPRQLRAPTCADVASAVALIAALTLDPDATTAPQAPALVVLPAGPSLELPEVTPPPPPPPVEPPAVEPPALPPASPAFELAAAGGARLAAGLTPGVLVLGAVDVAVRPRRQPWSGTLGVAAGADSAFDGVSGIRTTHALVLARALGCGGGAGVVELRACGVAELGWQRVAALDVPRATPAHRLWLAVGVRAELRYPGRGRWYGQLSAEVLAPLTRDRFVVTPATTVHQAAALVPALGLAVGLRR